jgi:3-hydroxyisobutyrate dehydrogenase-like beta-hydroxyacid dehydrogenase
MNIVMKMMEGVNIDGMEEGMELEEREGIKKKDVIEVLEIK